MNVYRCDWCGRFYSSPLPEDSACQNHIHEHNEQLRASIEHHNAKIFDQAHGLRPEARPAATRARQAQEKL